MRYDQTVDVMLLKSMTRNPDCSQQKYDDELTFNKYMTNLFYIVANFNQWVTLITVFNKLVQNVRLQCQNEQAF